MVQGRLGESLAQVLGGEPSCGDPDFTAPSRMRPRDYHPLVRPQKRCVCVPRPDARAFAALFSHGFSSAQFRTVCSGEGCRGSSVQEGPCRSCDSILAECAMAMDREDDPIACAAPLHEGGCEECFTHAMCSDDTASAAGKTEHLQVMA